MKNFKIFTSAVALAAICAACTDNETGAGNTDGRTALSIDAGIATRATDNAWQANDAIGIVLLKKGTNTPTNEGTNFKYITATGNGAFAAADRENTAWYPTDNSEVDILAYYPHNATVTATSLVVPVDVTSQANLSAIDLLTAPKAEGYSTKKPAAKLEFAHRLSKLVVSVKKNIDGTADDVDLNGATAVLQGTPATTGYDLLAGNFINRGENQDISLPLTHDAANAQLNATAIVIPTEAGKGLTIVLTLKDGRRFIVPFKTTDALTSGTINLLRITLHRTEASLTATVIPWAEGLDGAMTIHINTVQVEGDVDGASSFTPAAGDTLRLGSAELELDSVDYFYNATSRKWATASAPYWDYSQEGPFSFRALVSPKSAVGDNVLDFLYGTVTGINFGDDLAFSMSHLMSRLTVNVKPGTGYTLADMQSVVLKWAEITELERVILGTTNYQVMMKSTAKTVTLTQGTATAEVLPYSLIVAPQELAAEARKLTLTITGADGETRSYTLDFAKLKTADGQATGLTKVEAGKNYTLTATLNKHDASLTLAVADWTVVDAGDGGFDYNK